MVKTFLVHAITSYTSYYIGMKKNTMKYLSLKTNNIMIVKNVWTGGYIISGLSIFPWPVERPKKGGKTCGALQ